MTMPEKNLLNIAVDAMGGDNGVEATVAGTYLFLSRHDNAAVTLYGDHEQIKAYLSDSEPSASRINIIHTDRAISATDSPTKALRNYKESSMALAIEAAKSGEARVAVSAGNTGAVMVIAKHILRMLPGIERPALAAFVPTKRGKSIMLDLGANIECNSDNLVQFAISGEAFARYIFGIDKPSVAILNVGEEQIKGSDSIKAAVKFIGDHCPWLNFLGYVEGHNIIEGTADVIVTDGFTGNIVLKAMEGVANFTRLYIKKSFTGSLLSRIGYLFAKRSFKRTFEMFDHRLYNGAMLLGLNGIVVKSHGSADAVAFARALELAKQLAESSVNEYLGDRLAEIGLEEFI